MMKRFFLTLVIALCVHVVSPFDWPVENRVVISTFGDPDGTRFHGGIDLGGGRQDVRPIADGEVIFVHEENDPVDDLPSGNGTFLVLEHEGGLRSTYSHLEAGSAVSGVNVVTAGERIGVTGNTGAAEGVRLTLRVTDRELCQIINPLLILPMLKDRKAPVIRNLALLRQGVIEPLENDAVIPGGEVELLAQVFDPGASMPFVRPMAPYRITASQNGRQFFQLTCDSLKLEDGSFVLIPSDGIRFIDLYYSKELIRLGRLNLTPGRTGLEITSTDFEQNKSSVAVSFMVRSLEQ